MAFRFGPSNPTVQIGTQAWTKYNLRVNRYRNGDTIPQVQDPTEWSNLTTGAWCWYNNDSTNDQVYGKLYNWYAVNDPRGLAPNGFSIPASSDWDILTGYLGGTSVAGAAMKEAGLSHWLSPNTGATNSSGFTAFGGGIRSGIQFEELNSTGYYWDSTAYDSTNAYQEQVSKGSTSCNRYYNLKKCGCSVRLIKD